MSLGYSSWSQRFVIVMLSHTHTHTRTVRFNGHFSRWTWVIRV